MNLSKKGLSLIALMLVIGLALAMVAGCAEKADDSASDDTAAQDTVAKDTSNDTKEEEQTEEASKLAKYVFLFIGDGMALPQINSAEVFAGKKLSFSGFEAQGVTTTQSSDSVITDSAAAGTAMACGQKTYSGAIGVDPDGIKIGSISEMAKKAGMKVGIVSSVDIDHATPASFYSHSVTRKNYYQIAFELVTSDFDYFAGGPWKRENGTKGKNKKGLTEYAKENGFTVVDNDKAALEALNSDSGKVIAFGEKADGNALKYALDRDESAISLVDLTKKGIDVLNNENGFFMMVEGGKIDWACHANDAAASIKDTIEFSDSVQVAIDFYNEHPEETLIIVTGDHETGGMTLGFASTGYDTFFDKIEKQTQSYVAFDETFAKFKEENPESQLSDLYDEIEAAFGLKAYSDEDYAALKEAGDEAKLEMALTPSEMDDLEAAFERSMMSSEEQAETADDKTSVLYGYYNPLSVTLTHILNHKAGIGWTTYSHTAVPVATFAKGCNSDLFTGYYDNTDIFNYMKEAMGL